MRIYSLALIYKLVTKTSLNIHIDVVIYTYKIQKKGVFYNE